jgi:hypothetical protein
LIHYKPIGKGQQMAIKKDNGFLVQRTGYSDVRVWIDPEQRLRFHSSGTEITIPREDLTEFATAINQLVSQFDAR